MHRPQSKIRKRTSYHTIHRAPRMRTNSSISKPRLAMQHAGLDANIVNPLNFGASANAVLLPIREHLRALYIRQAGQTSSLWTIIHFNPGWRRSLVEAIRVKFSVLVLHLSACRCNLSGVVWGFFGWGCITSFTSTQQSPPQRGQASACSP